MPRVRVPGFRMLSSILCDALLAFGKRIFAVNIPTFKKRSETAIYLVISVICTALVSRNHKIYVLRYNLCDTIQTLSVHVVAPSVRQSSLALAEHHALPSTTETQQHKSYDKTPHPPEKEAAISSHAFRASQMSTWGISGSNGS